MQFSKRLDRFGDEVFASLNARRTELEAAGREVIDLSVGTPDFEPPAHVKNALIEAAKDSNNWKYALHDLPELTQAVIDYYADRFGVTGLTPDMIMSCNGTQEGMGRLSSALVDEGDLVLVPDPLLPAVPRLRPHRRRRARLLPPQCREQLPAQRRRDSR